MGLVSCSVVPVSALIRSPIDSKCQSYGLKGCPELVEGAIAYAEGDKPLALKKLERARALNTPEQLQKFAVALRTVGEASPEAGKPLLEVAALLSSEAEVRADVPTPLVPPAPHALPPTAARPALATQIQAPEIDDARRPSLEQLTLHALSARSDPMRLMSETVWTEEAIGVECKIGGTSATCVQPKQGPIIVTDIVASEECAQRVFLVTADSDTPAFGLHWLVPARAAGAHGSNLFVAGWQWLFVAIKPSIKPQPSDRGCFVTWAGFKPRLVPAVGRESGQGARK